MVKDEYLIGGLGESEGDEEYFACLSCKGAASNIFLQGCHAVVWWAGTLEGIGQVHEVHHHHISSLGSVQ